MTHHKYLPILALCTHPLHYHWSYSYELSSCTSVFCQILTLASCIYCFHPFCLIVSAVADLVFYLSIFPLHLQKKNQQPCLHDTACVPVYLTVTHCLMCTCVSHTVCIHVYLNCMCTCLPNTVIIPVYVTLYIVYLCT